jgi:hypothetical protein
MRTVANSTAFVPLSIGKRLAVAHPAMDYKVP